MAARRRACRDAVVALLKTITTGNGYNSDIGEVTDEKKSRRDISAFPAVIVGYGVEEKEQAAMHMKRGILTLRMVQFCEEPGAEDKNDDLSADIEKALETQVGGQFLSLGYVDEVTVILIDPADEKQSTALGMLQWVVEVEITYRHTRADP